MLPRTPRQVIDKAIEENRFGEWLLYSLATAFAVIGLVVLVWAALSRQPIVAIAGGISGSLFWPAIRSARQTRKESIAIRLLEAPLSRADTAEQAATMLHYVFRDLMLLNSSEAQSSSRKEAVGSAD
jgi:hypothetical protein